jgi:SAM-dependent methyltransferase
MAEPGSAAQGRSRDANTIYTLGSSEGERARLKRQAGELAADSRSLLDKVGLRPGDRAIDLGCGPRGVLDLLAERVLPGGQVTGLDSDPAATAMASEFVASEGYGEAVQIVTADARHTGLPSDSYDVVHTRTLLINIPDPAEVLTEMVRLAKPGGRVASLEYDMEHALCYPPHPAFTRLCEIFGGVFRRNGADPFIGRRLPELFRAAGLASVQVEARAPVYPPGSTRRTIRADLVRAMRPAVLQMGLATETELDELDAAARAHLEAPDTVTISGLVFLVWGRKQPAGSTAS